MRASEKLWRDFMIIDCKEKVFQQTKPFLPPSLGAAATYFLTLTLPGTLSTEISLHWDVIWDLGNPGRTENRSGSLRARGYKKKCSCTHACLWTRHSYRHVHIAGRWLRPPLAGGWHKEQAQRVVARNSPRIMEDWVARTCSSAWRWMGRCLLASTPHPFAVNPTGGGRAPMRWGRPTPGACSHVPPRVPPVGVVGAPCRVPPTSGAGCPLGTSLCGPCSRRRASLPRAPSPCSSQQWWPGRLGMEFRI